MNTTTKKIVAVSSLALALGSTLIGQNVFDSNQQIRQQANRPSANPLSDNSDHNRSMQEPTNRIQVLRRGAAEDPRGRTASDLIGLNVSSQRGEKLGEISDFIVDSQSGKVVYAFVEARGAGDAFRAIPFSALRQDVSGGSSRMIVDIDQAKWDQAPVFLKNQISSLGQDQRGREVFQYYGQSPVESRQLVSAREIIGSDIRSGGQTVGKVEDLIVQLQSGTAAALLDPNDDFVGSDQKYLIPLSRLSRSGRDELGTTLSRQDFAAAKPAADDSWARGPRGVDALYVWPSYATIQPSRPEGVAQSDPQPAIESIREALQSDSSAAGDQGVISVVASGDRVILGGTVRSNEQKERIESRVQQAAQGWNIDNQIRVAQEGE